MDTAIIVGVKTSCRDRAANHQRTWLLLSLLLFPALLTAEESWPLSNGDSINATLISYRNGTVILAVPDSGRQLLQIEAFAPESRERIRARFPDGDRRESKATTAKPAETKNKQPPPEPEPAPAPVRPELPHLSNRSIGNYPPDFRVTAAGSPEPIEFKTFRGKLVLVHFFSPRVEISIQSLPVLTDLHEKYASKGLQMIYVAMAGNRNVALAIRRQAGISWPGALDRDGELAKAWGIQMLPTVVLVNQAGIIVSDNLRISEIESEIRKHLGLPPEE